MALEAQVRSSYITLNKVGRWPNLTLFTHGKQNLIITCTDQSLGIPAPLIWKPHPRDKALEVWKP